MINCWKLWDPFRKLPKYKYSKLTWKTWLWRNQNILQNLASIPHPITLIISPWSLHDWHLPLTSPSRCRTGSPWCCGGWSSSSACIPPPRDSPSWHWSGCWPRTFPTRCYSVCQNLCQSSSPCSWPSVSSRLVE